MAWMDLDAPVEVTIGPYETYGLRALLPRVSVLALGDLAGMHRHDAGTRFVDDLATLRFLTPARERNTTAHIDAEATGAALEQLDLARRHVVVAHVLDLWFDEVEP
jgi:hypothetical protein